MKMATLLVVYLLLSIIPGFVAREQSASFYGESYISVPMEDAGSSTYIGLQFKTHRPHGLLLLAAGISDSLVLEVRAGAVEARINLGSGEANVFSIPSLRLDDHQWHHVLLNRTGAILQLVVDGVIQGSVQTPGSFHELNIHHGIFLGMGPHTSSVHSNLKSFRGCMKDVFFNNNDILTKARNMKNVKNTFEITWDCDSEFSEGSDVPISFLSETSFVAFSRFHIREHGLFACDFKTRSEMAVILFNSGHGDFKNDFFSLELVAGRPKVSVNSGSGVVEVVLMQQVNDGRWHQLDLSVSQSTVELRVDNVRNNTRFGGGKSHINLAGHLFVGGLGLKARPHALRVGLQSLQQKRSMKGSLVGCIRNIVINSRPFGFREVQVSRHVDSTCTWAFPCASDPCIVAAECLESVTDFVCVCDQPVCTKDSSEIDIGLPDVDIHELIAVEALNVKEGGKVVINSNAIDVIFDYRSYRIREIALLFRIVIPPRFGRLEVDRGLRQSESFTLLDLLLAKVVYFHDGTNTKTDDITIEMSISVSSELPQKLRGNYEFVLPIVITQHHDPPKFVLPSGNQVNVLQNSKLQMTSLIIDVRDLDTKSKDLKHHVSFIRPVDSLFENYNAAGVRVTEFNHEDILNGNIWFTVKEDTVIDIQFNVSDESALKDSIVLRLLAVPLKIEVVKNTGLRVPYTTSVIIQTANLSATTNVPLQNLELRYRVTKLPRFGQIQRLQHGTDDWTDVDTFTQRHLNKSRVRYSHFSSEFAVSFDEFSFAVVAKDSEIEQHVFQVTFESVVLAVTNNNRLITHQTPYALVNNSSLLVTPESGEIDTTQLTFSLLRAPKFGGVYVTAENRIFNSLDFESLEPVSTGNSFSQADIDSNKVYFKFDNTGYELMEDYLDLTVKYPSTTGRMLRFWVKYIPLDNAIKFTNNGLHDVPEGGQKVIRKSSLYLQMDNYKEFQFSIIQSPLYGNISFLDSRTSTILEPWIEEFSSINIREGNVVYQHDDSEHEKDSFMFAALPLFRSEEEMPAEIQEFAGTFHITIAMRNDNPPERLVDKVFNIVTNGRKMITISDLAFTDKDIHTNVSNLQYRCQNIPNGEILMAKTNIPVYQFKQKDLEGRNLVFQHTGSKLGRAAIFVSDGQFHWTGLFEIQASDPYIDIDNNTGITVLRGGKAIITKSNLSIETNLDLLPGDLHFMIVRKPQCGSLRISGKELAEFTYTDVLHGTLEYWHNGNNTEEDFFRFAIVHDNIQKKGIFPFMIEDDNRLHPPDVVRNQVLKVREGDTVQITARHLLLQHPSLNEQEMVFIITQPPQHGYLQVDGVRMKTGMPIQFSQGQISQGVVKYVQTQSAVTDDQFVFDVDSDTHALKKLIFSIEVLPSFLPMMPGNITVKEGGAVTLLSDTLKTTGSQFQDEELIFEIVNAPAHGYIVHFDHPNVFDIAFSSTSLAAGKIAYQHDGSESMKDSFAVVAAFEDGSLKSHLLVVEITVIPQDDQPPQIVVNKGLSVWADSVTLITSNHLYAEDPDTSSSDITFSISSASNGHLAFLNNTLRDISHFSQLDIDTGQVAFVHKGESVGKFSLQASDGLNKDIWRTFHVWAQPVVLQLQRSGPLMIFPNTIHPLTNTSLLATTSSVNFSKPIVYTLVDPVPERGRMVTLVSGRVVEIASFTQAEVDDGRVFFQHTSYMEGWQQNDTLHFDLATAYATRLSTQVCHIHISFTNINSQNKVMLLGMYELSVNEGGSAIISTSHFDSTELLQRLHAFQAAITMTFHLDTLPHNGHLFLDEEELFSPVAFTQDDINQERLKYTHDDSDTTYDVFSFSVEIERHSEGGRHAVIFERHVLNFTIKIEPVNDQEFTLVTQNPRLQVLQGGEVQLTQDNLLTVDPDTPADNIIYTVLSEPTNGKLTRSKYVLVKLDTFTQQEINEDKLVFSQNGTSKSGSMNFKVTDGKFPALYIMLDVCVIPVEIEVNRVKSIDIIQSESSIYISKRFLNISTNGNREHLHYFVTESPRHGHILLKGQDVNFFSQKDVDTDSVLYVMLNFNQSSDVFQCDLSMDNLDVWVKNLTVHVTVKPLVSHKPLIAPAGSSVTIQKANLDASELAARTGENPVFEVLSPPRHGHILKKLRKKRNLIAQPVLKPVEKFTFEDVLYAKILYISNVTEGGELFIPDAFSYVLRAGNAQPAHGKFLVNVDETEDVNTDNEKHDSDRGKDFLWADTRLSNDDNNDWLIVGLVLGNMLVVAVVVVVVVVVLWRKRGQQMEQYGGHSRKLRPHISSPLQLEQPHIHIEPQLSPSQGGEDNSCLVGGNTVNIMPLIGVKGEGEKATSVGDRQSGQSSASADLFDWTLMDPELLEHCRTENPVLRENQYWV